MRKSNPFVAIPTVPRTVSGQWLTFSHMANHYRKLLNVKARVQTNAPRPPSTPALQASSQKLSKKLSRSTSRGTKRVSGAVGGNVALEGTRRSPRRPTRTKSYQIIFDQSELNNLSEAVMSDSEVEGDEPNVQPMEISEKIRLYLDQLEESAFDESQSGRSLSPYAPDFGKDRRKLGRHSQCFVPHVESSKRKSNTKIKISQPVLLKGKRETLVSGTPKKGTMPKAETLSSRLKANQVSSALKSTDVRNSKTLNPSKVLPEKGGKTFGIKTKAAPPKKGEKGGSSCSQNSASIGTVRGSDELTGHAFTSLLSQCRAPAISQKRKVEERIGGYNDPTSLDWLPSRDSSLRLRSANNLKMSSTNTLGILNNKDSSRDSAYGFSSGESKITTRESTPEKRKTRKKVHVDGNGEQKYKSNLSTVASSINQDSSANSFHHEPKNKEKINAKDDRGTKNTNLMTDETYVNFITAVTEDIVLREIFTNKGLKSLFQSHIDANRHLDMDKMLYMLDRLRMDVGVPKDDSLNQLEFGYGSIKYSAGAFFSKFAQMAPGFENEDFPQKLPPTNTSTTLRGDVLIARTGVPTTSDVTLLELHRHKLPSELSADESSKASSCSASMFNETAAGLSQHELQNEGPTFQNEVSRDDSKGSSPPSSKSSDLSLTQSQVQMALAEAGFDTEETLDILRIVREGGSRRRQEKKIPVELEPNNNQPLISELTKRSRSKKSSIDSF